MLHPSNPAITDPWTFCGSSCLKCFVDHQYFGVLQVHVGMRTDHRSGGRWETYCAKTPWNSGLHENSYEEETNRVTIDVSMQCMGGEKKIFHRILLSKLENLRMPVMQDFMQRACPLGDRLGPCTSGGRRHINDHHRATCVEITSETDRASNSLQSIRIG